MEFHIDTARNTSSGVLSIGFWALNR